MRLSHEILPTLKPLATFPKVQHFSPHVNILIIYCLPAANEGGGASKRAQFLLSGMNQLC